MCQSNPNFAMNCSNSHLPASQEGCSNAPTLGTYNYSVPVVLTLHFDCSFSLTLFVSASCFTIKFLEFSLLKPVAYKSRIFPLEVDLSDLLLQFCPDFDQGNQKCKAKLRQRIIKLSPPLPHSVKFLTPTIEQPLLHTHSAQILHKISQTFWGKKGGEVGCAQVAMRNQNLFGIYVVDFKI